MQDFIKNKKLTYLTCDLIAFIQIKGVVLFFRPIFYPILNLLTPFFATSHEP